MRGAGTSAVEVLYWPHLDVDLTIDSIEHPDRYPLRSNTVAEDSPKRLER